MIQFLRKLVKMRLMLAALATVVLYLVLNNLTLALPLLYGAFLEKSMAGHLDIGQWLIWLLMGLLLVLLKAAVSSWNVLCKESVQNQMMENLYRWSLGHVDAERESLGAGYYKNFLIKNAVQAVSLIDINSLGSLINTISFFIIAIIIAKINVVCGAATLILGVLAVMFHKIGGNHYSKYGEQVQTKRLHFFSDIEDTLKGADVILSYDAQREESKRNQKQLNELMQCEKKVDAFRFINFFVGLDFFKTAYLFFVMGYSFFLVAQGELSLAMAATLILYSQMTTNPIQYLNYVLQQLQEGMTAFRLLRAECQKETVREVSQPIQGDFSCLQCKNLSFRYEGKKVLENINLEFSAGEHYWLNAASGAGKTTLLRILMKELTPEKGEVLIDGQSSAQRIPAVFLRQDSVLFHAGIVENICFEQRPDEKVLKLIDMMELNHLLPFAVLPKDISGGEKSRILLARALWNMDRDIILDEPLIGVGKEQKERILLSVAGLLKDRFLILVTHEPELPGRLGCRQLDL